MKIGSIDEGKEVRPGVGGSLGSGGGYGTGTGSAGLREDTDHGFNQASSSSRSRTTSVSSATSVTNVPAAPPLAGELGSSPSTSMTFPTSSASSNYSASSDPISPIPTGGSASAPTVPSSPYTRPLPIPGQISPLPGSTPGSHASTFAGPSKSPLAQHMGHLSISTDEHANRSGSAPPMVPQTHTTNSSVTTYPRSTEPTRYVDQLPDAHHEYRDPEPHPSVAATNDMDEEVYARLSSLNSPTSFESQFPSLAELDSRFPAPPTFDPSSLGSKRQVGKGKDLGEAPKYPDELFNAARTSASLGSSKPFSDLDIDDLPSPPASNFPASGPSLTSPPPLSRTGLPTSPAPTNPNGTSLSGSGLANRRPPPPLPPSKPPPSSGNLKPKLPSSNTVLPLELWNYVNNPNLSVLLLDLREREEYEREKVKGGFALCMDPLTLRPGCVRIFVLHQERD